MGMNMEVEGDEWSLAAVSFIESFRCYLAIQLESVKSRP